MRLSVVVAERLSWNSSIQVIKLILKGNGKIFKASLKQYSSPQWVNYIQNQHMSQSHKWVAFCEKGSASIQL